MIVLLVLIVGCAVKFGRDFDAARVTEIKRGYTTRAELLQFFGEPFSDQIWQSGGHKLIWINSQTGKEHKALEVIITNNVVSDFSFQRNKI